MNERAPDPEQQGLRLTLDIWHPNCWTLKVTADRPGGLLGHGVYTSGSTATGRFTVYGSSRSEVTDLIDAIRDSHLTDSVWVLDDQVGAKTATQTPGKATQGLFVEYNASNSINDALVLRGFVPDKPVRMTDGREYWTMLVNQPRSVVQDLLEEIREEKSAEVKIVQIASREVATDEGVFRVDPLSARQREVFQTALEEGYYTWPRQTSAADLANMLDVSKPTLLEHLRKAEAKIFQAMF